jgi:plastocyanin
MRIVRRTILGIVAMSAVALPAPAGAKGTPVIVTPPGSYLASYHQPLVVAQAGDAITYVNLDVQGHNVVSTLMGPDTAAHCTEDADPFTVGIQPRFPDPGTCPLIWSATIAVASQTPVRGLENIQPLTVYEYYCGPHPNMKGRLVTLPNA